MNIDSEPGRDGGPIEEWALQWFVRLRSGNAALAERRQFESWLEGDSRNRAAYEALDARWAEFGRFAGEPELARRVRNAGKAARAEGERTRRTRERRGWFVAVAVSVALVAVLVGRVGSAPEAPAELYVTSVGEQRHLVLSDGTEVDLDANGALRVVFGDHQRLLQLQRGRAYFRVAREHRPLRVETANGSVQAVGTAFEVNHRLGEVDVTLIEGRVLLWSSVEGGAARPLPMDAGHVARLARGADAPEIERLHQSTPPAWMSGLLVFDDRELSDVVAEFNRYSARPISLDPRLSSVRVSGVFRSDDPAAFLGAMRDLYGLQLTDTEAVTWIKPGTP